MGLLVAWLIALYLCGAVALGERSSRRTVEALWCLAGSVALSMNWGASNAAQQVVSVYLVGAALLAIPGLIGSVITAGHAAAARLRNIRSAIRDADG